MTLAGKQNHYNVKFLKGYGFSIKVRKNKLVFKNSYDPFKEPEVEEWFITNLPYKKIVLCGKGYISTEALGLLCEHNRNVILCDTYGKPISYMNPVMESWTGTKYRMGQYDTFRIPEKMRYLTKQIVKAKIQSTVRQDKKYEVKLAICSIPLYFHSLQALLEHSYTNLQEKMGLKNKSLALQLILYAQLKS